MRQHSKELIRCAAKRWEVPGGGRRAICVADRESGLDPRAMSANRRYRGLFQHDKRYWPDRRDAYSRDVWELNQSVLNGRTSAIVTARMVSRAGWGAWRGQGC